MVSYPNGQVASQWMPGVVNTRAHMGIALDISMQCPALCHPERRRNGVGCEYVNVVFQDAELLQLTEATPNQNAGNALPPVGRQNGKVRQVAPPPVVACHDATNHLRVMECNKAQARIQGKVTGDGFARIRRTQGDTSYLSQQTDNSIVISHGHCPEQVHTFSGQPHLTLGLAVSRP